MSDVVHALPRRSIIDMAREAVDLAIQEAVDREVARRREEIMRLIPGPDLSLGDILTAVCDASGLPLDALSKGRKREPNVRHARWLYIYLAYSLRPDLNATDIADTLRMERTSVFYTINNFVRHRQTSPLSEYCTHPSVAVMLAKADAVLPILRRGR